jgi:uncharacterized protein YlbG (UPF0298 family)
LQKIDNEVKGLSGYDRDNEICRIAVRRYTERWRKKYGKTLRHWLVTELGHENTERVHMHGIVWTDKVKDIKEIWKYGKVWIGDYVSAKTINYIVKYVNKVDEKHKTYNSKIFTSKGIGREYMERKDSGRNKYKKVDAGATGSMFLDMMKSVGLDPVNNEEDKWIVRGIMTAYFGSDVILKISKSFPPRIAKLIKEFFRIPTKGK